MRVNKPALKKFHKNLSFGVDFKLNAAFALNKLLQTREKEKVDQYKNCTFKTRIPSASLGITTAPVCGLSVSAHDIGRTATSTYLFYARKLVRKFDKR